MYQLLPENQKEKWVNLASSNPAWNSFYTFLGDVYEKALLKKQINDSCKQNLGQDKNTCNNCKRSGHTADKCYSRRVLTTTIGVDACPACEGSLHQVEVNTKEGPRTITSRRLVGCPKFSSANDEVKKEIFLKVKGKMQELCQLCTGWNHDTSKCASKTICRKCNSKHWSEACALQQIASCTNVGTNLIKLCVQDLPAIVSS